jgi:TRAP-type mannitol/chloroaromatic compound transport system substrate-binding protein
MFGKRLILALAGVAALGLAATATSAEDKKVRMNIAGAYPSTTAILGTAQLYTVQKIKKLSGGSVDAKFFEPGALVPPSQYLDAVASGSLDAAWTSIGFFTGKEIAFTLYATVPFGPEAGEYLGWMRFGGGEQQMKELLAKFNVEVLLCGIIAPEASGWFRKEIKTLDDLKGLKMRFFGLGANVMQKLGVATQLLAPGEIFQALQLGTIDATEFSMPVMDLTLGFHQVAKHYYFPGWHQMSTFNHLLVSKQKWAELSDTQKEILTAACDMTMLGQYAEGEAVQAKALRDVQAKGVTLHRWPKAFLDAYDQAWKEVIAEQSAKSAEFKKGWESLSKFREEYKVWRQYGYLQ